jgi:hypothetical protein
MDEVALEQVLPSTSLSSAYSHSIKSSILIYHLGLV